MSMNDHDLESGKSSSLSPRAAQKRQTKGPRPNKNRQGVILLALNFVAAICCIFANKILLKPPASFRFPISITFIGYSSSVIGIEICRYFGFLKKHSGNVDSINGKPQPWRSWINEQPWMLIVSTAGAPLLANYSLLLNSVGVYQLSKVLVSPSILFFEKLRGGAPLSTKRMICLIVVSVGVTVVTAGDVELNLPGMLVATSNILVAGFYKVEWGHTCRSQQISSLSLMSKVMPQATCLLFVAALCLEGKHIYRYEFTPYTFVVLGLAGSTAFFTSWTGYMVIAQLSAIAHQLLGQAKTCLILLAGALFFNSPLTSTQMVGAVVAMSAMVYYSVLSISETQHNKPTHQDFSRHNNNNNGQDSNFISIDSLNHKSNNESLPLYSSKKTNVKSNTRYRKASSHIDNNSAFII